MNRLAFSFLLMALFLFGAAPFLYSSELNILASQDVNNSKESSDHKHVNISIGMYGGGSASVSMDRSKGSSDGVTSTNSQLSGNNINITTEETTTIAGANIAANDELNITTEHLKVASAQDSHNSRSQSSGFSLSGGSEGLSGAGVNAGNSRSRAKETVLTTLTGNKVNIDVEEDTTIRGALIAAVDENGDDNGNLTLKTDTLEVGSLNNRRDSKSMSMGINVGISGDSVSSVGIDYANDRSNSKTKTLGTIGNGNIEVANVDGSNTKLLNRDINDNEIDIYNVESHRGLKGTVDTRVFTEDGRNAIAEDFERTERLGKAIGDVASKDAFELKDTFAHIDETQKDLDVQKAFALENDGKNIEALQGAGSTIEEKQAAIKLYAEIYAKTYGVDIESANIIATSKVISGSHYGKDGKSTIDINDNAQRNATDYANTMGHEVAHARVSQGKVRDRKSEKLNEEYADTMGGYSADGMEFSAGTYTTVSLDPNAVTNTHVRTADDKKLLTTNNKNWRDNVQRAKNGDGKMDYRELYKREAQMLDQAKQQINQKSGLTVQQKQLMNLQLNAAACAKIKCAEGVPTDDAQYKQLTQLQAIGDSLQAKGLTIEKMLGGALPEDTFDYGFTDKVQDTVTKHDEAVQRGKGAVNAGLGTAGTVVGAAATVATAPLCTTGVGCLAPAGTAVLTGLAAAQAVDGASTLFGDYTSEEGQRVLDSFTEETHQGDRSLIKDAAVDTALWVGETVVINKVAKLIPDSVKDKVKDFVTGKQGPNVQAGSKGNWNSNLNKPEPNKVYKVDTGHTFTTDELGRVKKVDGELKLDPKDRNTYQQCKAGNCGDANDEGGHLIASILGGPGEKINLVPMNANLNKGAWKQMENTWGKALKDGKKVKVNIEPVYSGSSVRPDKFNVTYQIAGKKEISVSLKNSPGGL